MEQRKINRVIMENDLLKVEILPEYGGKISSLLCKQNGFDAAAPNTGKGYFMADADTPFAACDASGLDDGFPSLLAETVKIGDREYTYTDHGEIWRQKFVVQSQSSEQVELLYCSNEYPYRYHKSIELAGDRLILNYCIENLSKEVLPCLWVFHGLMHYSEDMILIYPKGTEHFRNAQTDAVLGEEGIIYEYSNKTYDFTKVPSKESMDTKKYYIEGSVREGYCCFRYPKEKMQCELHFDAAKLPYLGVWITAGGFRGDYNCAFEPATGFYDSISKCLKHDSVLYLKGGDIFSHSLEIRLGKCS